MRTLAFWLGLASAVLWLLILLLLTAISPSITYTYRDTAEHIDSAYTVSCDAVLYSRGETESPRGNGSYNGHYEVTDGEDVYGAAQKAAALSQQNESAHATVTRFEHEIEIDCAHARTTRLAWVGIIAIPATACAMSAAKRRRTDAEPTTQ